MMLKKTKIIAAYLPQYHEIPENNQWWGNGYTDWVAVKNAKPLLKGQIQPRVPYGGRYYALDDVNALRWQAKLAKEYGIYAFGIYHYWFSEKQNLLTKPAELLLENKDIDVKFCFIWDNHSWVNGTWKNIKFVNQWSPKYERNTDGSDGILAKLEYGNEHSWKSHYEYLRRFFKDDRYVKIDNCPVFGIFASDNEPEVLKNMCSCLKDMAIKDGFKDLIIISTASHKKDRIDLDFRYEPFCAITLWDRIKRKIMRKKKLKIFSYDRIWSKILFNAKFFPDEHSFYGGFVRYDDTPRRGEKASIVKGETPQKFRKYFDKLLQISEKQGKEFVYLTAWNEWGEGAYLEPDKETGYEYLEAIKKVMEKHEDKVKA